MKQIANILKYKLLAFLKLNKNPDFISVSKSIGSSSIYGIFAVGAYLFTKELLAYLLITLKLGTFLVHEFLSIVLFIFFLSINVGNIIVSYSTLYRSQEVNYLFTKPLSSTKIFLVKFLDNFFYSSSTLFFILLSFMAGYASFFHLDIVTIVLLFFTGFIPFMVSAASLGVIILILFLLIAKRIGIRTTVTILAVLYLTAIVFFFNSSSPVGIVNNVMKYYPNVDLYFGQLLPSFLKFMPNEWLSSSMYWLLKGKTSLTIGFSALQIFLAALLFIFALLMGSIFYRKTWLLIPSIMSTNKRKVNSVNTYSKHSPEKISIIKKDILLFRREPSQVIHAVILMFMLMMFVSSVSGVQLFSYQNSQLRAIIFLAVYIFNIFLVATLALRFVFPILSLEGMEFWKLKTAPVNQKIILFHKLLPSLLIILLISLLLTFFSTRIFSSEMIIFSLTTSLLITVGIIFLNFSMGGLFANYKEKNPIRISSSQGASVTFLATIFYMTFLIFILYFPVHDYFEYLSARLKFKDVDFTTPLLIVFLMTLILLLVSNILIQKTLKKDY